MSMNETQVNVMPSSPEMRDQFAKDVNEIIKLRDVVQSAKESEKNILTKMYEDHKAERGDNALKKGKFNKRIKGILAEYFSAKKTEELTEAEEVLTDYQTIKNKLI